MDKLVTIATAAAVGIAAYQNERNRDLKKQDQEQEQSDAKRISKECYKIRNDREFYKSESERLREERNTYQILYGVRDPEDSGESGRSEHECDDDDDDDDGSDDGSDDEYEYEEDLDALDDVEVLRSIRESYRVEYEFYKSESKRLRAERDLFREKCLRDNLL